MVLPLSSNGGPTLTFNLQPGSPAIDAIPGTPGVDFPVLDQRGFPRPIGPLADIGALEFGTPGFSISGVLTRTAVTTNLTNIVITAAGSGFTYSTMPNAAGFYSFPALPPDTYTIIPQPTNGFSFSPVNLSVTLAVTNENSTTNNFSATPTFMLGGIISNLTTTATVILFATNSGNNTQFAQTTTASTGVYTFTNVPNGALIVPQQTSTTGFATLSQTVMNLLADNTNVNFSAGAPTFQVVGQIANTGGAAVTVKANSTVSFTANTDVNGNYTLNLVQGTYTVTPQPTNGLTSFTPTSQFVTVPPSTNLAAFTAQGSSSTFTMSGLVSNLHMVMTMTAMSAGNSTPLHGYQRKLYIYRFAFGHIHRHAADARRSDLQSRVAKRDGIRKHQCAHYRCRANHQAIAHNWAQLLTVLRPTSHSPNLFLISATGFRPPPT